VNNACVRFGIIGAGWMGSHHGHNLLQSTQAELVAIADHDDNAVQRFTSTAGHHHPVRSYRDYEELLAQPDIDAVVIASPNARHAEHAIAAAQAGKHIYLEKPMAITLPDCRKIAEAVRAAGVKCAMGYHRRLNPLVQYAQGLSTEGKLGALVLAESDYIHHIPGDWVIWEWLGKEEIAGSLIHAGVGHNIDLLRFFCGEVREVSCFKDARMPRSTQVETEDIAIINLRFANGTLGRCVLFVGPILPFTFTLRLYGTRGTVDNNRVFLDTIPRFAEPGYERDAVTLPASWIPDNVQGSVAETWAQCLGAFIDDLCHDRAPANDAVSGFNTAAVCFAAVQSAVENRTVTPELL